VHKIKHIFALSVLNFVQIYYPRAVN